MRRFTVALVVALAFQTAPSAWTAEKPKSYPNSEGRLVWDRVRFLPAPGYERDMLGGKFSGSNLSSTDGFEVLAEIKAVPPTGQWTEMAFDGKRPHRWIRYEAPPGSFGHIGKLEFYAGQRRLGGQGFGSIGAKQGGRDWPRVFDGKDTQCKFWMDSDEPDGQYVGLDVGEAATAVRPAFDPPPGDFNQSLTISLKCPTPGATIRYTLDGTLPSATNGTTYQAPIAVSDVTTISAVALKNGFAPSPANEGTYLIGPSVKPGLSTFHIGNSLTASAGRFPIYARAAGYKHTYEKYLQPGIWTSQLWEVDVLKTKEPWEKTLASIQRIDHFTVQPRDPDIAHEAGYDILFFNLIAKKSPDMQPWFYAEWPVPRQRNAAWDQGAIPSTQMAQVFPAFTWEESAAARMLYMEDLQTKVCQTYRGAKRPRILPAALAMGWLKHLLDEGKIPGMGSQDIDRIMYRDGVHPGPEGSYLIDLVWYAAFYRHSPEGNVPPLGAGLNTAQAAAFQRLAWDVVKNYPDCGLYEEGKTPVERPQFAPAPDKINAITRITLSSATPGAWFRYTLDGTVPTRTRGYLYCGVISAQPGMTIKAIAYRSGMADSTVSEATYPSQQPVSKAPPMPDGVVLDRDIQYGQAGVHPLLLDIVRPKQDSPKPRPVILFIHGGGWAAGDKVSAIGALIPYAASGQYFCATANYRLSGQAPWPAQLHDCKAAVRWLKANARKLNIDPEKIGVWGHSAGGHLVSMLGLTGTRADLEGRSGSLGPDSRVACVVDWAGPTDMVKLAAPKSSDNRSSPGFAKLFGEPIERWQEVARHASPLTYVAAGAPPFLIVNGTDDRLVPLTHAEELHAALKKAGANSTLIKILGGGHGIIGGEVNDRTRTFFDKYLRSQAVEVSGEPIQAPPMPKTK